MRPRSSVTDRGRLPGAYDRDLVAVHSRHFLPGARLSRGISFSTTHASGGSHKFGCSRFHLHALTVSKTACLHIPASNDSQGVEV